MSKLLNARKIELANDVVEFVEQYNDCISHTDVLRKCESVDCFDSLEDEVTIAIDTGNIEALSGALI
jgi:hypothetical protein